MNRYMLVLSLYACLSNAVVYITEFKLINLVLAIASFLVSTAIKKEIIYFYKE